MFQIGVISLPASVISGSVTFATAFASTPNPPLVIPVVINTSADSPKYLIEPVVTALSTTGFSYTLSGAPNTTNYQLVYLAGAPSVLFAAITAYGKRLTQLPIFSGVIGDSDRIPFVSMSPVPTTYALTIGILKTLFTGILSAIPTDPTDLLGETGFITADDDYFYVQGLTRTGRIPVQWQDWAIPDLGRKRQEFQAALASGQQVQTINFPVAYGIGVHPLVNVTCGNTTDSTIVMLYAMVTAVTNTSVTITLNGLPDSANYVANIIASAPQS